MYYKKRSKRDIKINYWYSQYHFEYLIAILFVFFFIRALNLTFNVKKWMKKVARSMYNMYCIFLLNFVMLYLSTILVIRFVTVISWFSILFSKKFYSMFNILQQLTARLWSVSKKFKLSLQSFIYKASKCFSNQ